MCYIKQGWWWKTPAWYDTSAKATYQLDYHFTFDSVSGRGDQRRALFSFAFKACDTTGRDWIWRVERRAPFVPDTLNPGWQTSLTLWDTLGRTVDSTQKIGRWLTYSRKMLDPVSGGFYTYAGTIPVEEWGAWFPNSPYNWKVTIRMEKILGDPTVNNGWNQRAVFKMALFQVPNDSLCTAVCGGTGLW